MKSRNIELIRKEYNLIAENRSIREPQICLLKSY